VLRESFKDNPGVLRKMMMGLFEASKIPGDVYQGNREATPEAGMEFALNFGGAGSMVPKPSNSLGIFGGRSAKNYPHSREPIAEYMEQGGVAPEKIWEATGLARGKEGKWRFEIDDSKAVMKLKPEAGDEYPMSSAIEHPDLYAAYPELGAMDIYGMEPSRASRGQFLEADPRLRTGVGQIGINPRLSPEEARSTALHELQHAVQSIEGFARGGNPGEGGKNTVEKINRVNRSLNLVSRRMSGEVPKTEKQALKTAYDGLLRLRQEFVDQADPYLQYRRLAGETEARNVQSRDHVRTTLGNEFLDQFPARTEDMPRNKQIVKYR
jgi:hypothetical protein